MAGAFLLALIGAAVARAAQPRLTASLLPWLERAYEELLRLSRLPPSIFPRR